MFPLVIGFFDGDGRDLRLWHADALHGPPPCVGLSVVSSQLSVAADVGIDGCVTRVTRTSTPQRASSSLPGAPAGCWPTRRLPSRLRPPGPPSTLRCAWES